MDKQAAIYALCDPISGEVRYIGKANDPARRLSTHLRDARRRRTPVYDWISKLVRQGNVPTIRVLASSVGDWRDLEPMVIKQYIDDGARLLNVADGGDEPFCPKEIRALNGPKAAAARVKDQMSADVYRVKRALSQLLAAGHGSELTRAKIRKGAMKRPDLFGALLKWV